MYVFHAIIADFAGDEKDKDEGSLFRTNGQDIIRLIQNLLMACHLTKGFSTKVQIQEISPTYFVNVYDGYL